MPSRVVTKRMDSAFDALVRNPAGVDDFYGARIISLALLVPNPDQPRKGPLRNVEELASSIKEHGLLQPIVVGPRRADGKYVIHAGHRRKAAYDWLAEHDDEPVRWLQIPVIEREGESGDRLIHALIENLSRDDLTESEIITGLRVLHDLRQWSQAEIARHLGVSRSWITQYFRVAGDPAVSEQVQTGELRVGKAYEIVLARTPEAKRAALQAALGGASVATVRRLARETSAVGSDGTTGTTGAAGRNGAATETVSNPNQEADSDSWARPGAANDTEYYEPDDQSVPVVASAPADAGVRDFAELADELDVRVDLLVLQFSKLVKDALAKGTPHARAGDVLRLMRADLKRVEALVRNSSIATR